MKSGITCVISVLFDDDIIMTSDTDCLQDCVERDQGKRPIGHIDGPHCGVAEVRYAVDDRHAEAGRHREAIDDIQQGRSADLKTQ